MSKGQLKNTDDLKSLKADVNRLYKNLKTRQQNVKKRKGGRNSPAFRSKLWKSIRGRTSKGLPKKKATLEKLKNDLLNMNNYSSSYVKGAVSADKTIAKLQKRYDRNHSKTNAITDLYHHLVEENPLVERYKYEILDKLLSMTNKDLGWNGNDINQDKIRKDILNDVKEWYKEDMDASNSKYYNPLDLDEDNDEEDDEDDDYFWL